MKKQNIVSVLNKLITKGESEYVEFKSNLPLSEVLAKIFVAFAKTNGGYLIVGAGDISPENAHLIFFPFIESNISSVTFVPL